MKKLTLEQHEFDVIRSIMAELFNSGNDNVYGMTEDEINAEVIRRFWDYTN